ncbi:MAG TPA: TolC family protein, partial [Albitalea sp.]
MTARRRFPRAALAAACAAAAWLAGCALPPRADTNPPSLELPTGSPAVAPVPSEWWRSFADPRLDALVDEALRDNRDLARAAARIDQSRAALRLARADRLPAVSAGVSAGRQRASENGAVPLMGASPIGSSVRTGVNVA